MSRRKGDISTEQHHALVWQQFQKVVDPRVLEAPRLNWKQVDRTMMNYICMFVAGTPWVNHLAFLTAVSTCHTRLDLTTIKGRLQILHLRWKTIFQMYKLADFAEWNPIVHLPQYMHDLELEDSLDMRHAFLASYTGATRSIQIYLRSLPEAERQACQQWEFPPLPPEMRGRLSKHRDLLEAQRHRRKIESDAVTPHFARIRSEAHLRWNELSRLRQNYREAVALVEAGQSELPVSFSYEEPRRKCRLHFLLWDRPSFVLAHGKFYHGSMRSEATRKILAFAPERNHFFLEFVGSQDFTNPSTPCDPDALLWFGDLLRYGVLGQQSTHGTLEEIERKQAYLRSWGYGGDEENKDPEPFNPAHSGLLVEEQANGSPVFLRAARKRTTRLLFLVEPLYAAATFGLAALDFFTTTGARMSELLQLSLSPDCLYTMEVGGSQRLLVRLIPKGTDKPADYMVGLETYRNLERVAHLLKEHYHLQPGDTLPRVPFHMSNKRAHQFPDARPYLFQYHGAHFPSRAITACMRFLLHGMVFQGTDGKIVILKAHLLRHIFATHLHQVEQLPLDLVAAILHQKDVRVTGYYAAPPWQQVVETTDQLLDRFASHLGNIEEIFVRSPIELQRQWETARQSAGTLAKVPGGDCTCHALCPFSYVCTGCVYKVPDPARREEVVEQKQWAMIRLDQVKRRGMGPETVKMQALIHRCEAELEEMNLIEEYRRDETYRPKLRIEAENEYTQPGASLATETLSGETRANGTSGKSRRQSAPKRRASGDH